MTAKTSQTSPLGDLIRKRSGAGGAPTKSVHILVDVERHAELRPQWEASRLEGLQAQRRHDQIDEKDTAAREQAKAELDAADAESAALKGQLRDCFVTVTLRGMTSSDLARAAAKAGTDAKAFKDEQIKAALVKISDAEGNEITDITPAVFMKFLAASAFGDEEKILMTIQELNSSVDFPM